MKNKFLIIALSVFFLFNASTYVLAHPGKTASDGCHYCRTNCDKWGVPWNERHCHGGGTTSEDTSGSSGGSDTSSQQAPIVQPTQVIYYGPTSTPKPTRTPTSTRTPTPTRTPIPTPPKTIDVLLKLRSESKRSKKNTWVNIIQSSYNIQTKTSTKTVTPTPTPYSDEKNEMYKVFSIVDGDTIRLIIGGKVDTVRLLAMDTPEVKDPRKAIQCFGDAASRKMSELAEGKMVKIEKDHSQGDRDKYNRLLRYVYLEDGIDVGAEMIKQGYAFAYTRFPSDKLDEYRSYEKQARESGVGLWGSCQIQESGTTKSTNPV